MPTSAEILSLVAELDSDITALVPVEEDNLRAVSRIEAGATDQLDYAALGYTIHNLYSILENYALRVAKLFGNDLDPASWHRDLVHRMSLEIEGVRPRVWDRRTAQDIDEIRRFRHRFRSIYANRIDPVRVSLVQGLVPGTIEVVRRDHEVLRGRLVALAEEMESLS